MSRLEPGVFGPLERELEPVARKKIAGAGAGAAWEKKSGARAA